MDILSSSLQKFGLTQNEAKVYLSLLKLREAKASVISNRTGIARNKIYEICESLNKKGFIEIIPEKITKFRPLQFKEAIKIRINEKERELEDLLKSGEDVDKYLEHMEEDSDHQGRFAVLNSQDMIKKKAEEMIRIADKEVLMIINSTELRNLFYAVRDRKDVDITALCPIEEENLELCKNWVDICNFRTYDSESKAKMIITDKEVLIYKSDDSTALHSTDFQFITIMKTFFDSSLKTSFLGKDKIESIETGKPLKQTLTIRGRKKFFDMVPQLAKEAKKDFTIATSANGLIRISKYTKDSLEEAAKRGIKVRLICPITKKNADYIKKMPHFEIRHVEKVASVVNVIDDSTFIIIQIEEDNKRMDSPEDTIIMTNQKPIVRTMRHMIEHMWESALPAEIRTQELVNSRLRIRIKDKDLFVKEKI